MQKLLKKIEATQLAFGAEVAKPKNKSAQARARKFSLELRELYKQFREKSLAQE